MLLAVIWQRSVGKKTAYLSHDLNAVCKNKLLNQCYMSRVQTYLWVLNEEDEYARALYYGASGIMTDFPSRLSQYLDHRNNYSEHWTMLSS